jgi:uncharacterized protein (TIGR02266 family)
MTESKIENRAHPRVDIVLCVRTTDPLTNASPQKTNISEGGMFIQTDQIYPIGSVIGIELNLQDNEGSLFIKARVVRSVQPGQGRIAGMGVEFMSVPPRELSRLRRIVWGAMGGKTAILIITNDQQLGDMMWAILSERCHRLIRARNLSDLSSAASEHKVDLVVVDIDRQDKELRELKALAMDLPMVVISKKVNLDLQSKAATLGIFELVEKPVSGDRLLQAITHEIQSTRLHSASSQSRFSGANGRVQLIARSPAMQEVVRQMMALAHVPHPVLITGDTGVGKEVVARALYAVSSRRTLGFVVADCTMMDKNLMVSMLFGHEKGSFTGAQAQHRGLVEQAGDGTLFLDEIGELSTEGQAKLLRLLESGTYRRIGGTHDLICKARIIAATNRDLRSMVRDGAFRQDLMYRLQVHTMVVPPLVKRPEDLVHLAHILLTEVNEECKTNVTVLGPEALAQLTTHSWSGNVRELKNVIAASVVGIDGDTLSSLKLPANIDPADSRSASPTGDRGKKITWEEFTKATDQQVRNYLVDLMKQFNGNITAAAAHAGMTRQNLSKKLKEHEIKSLDFR